jgi:predicted ribosome quality control (RQC) complex YloA/Tae2 family protein
MYYDALTTAAVADELRHKVLDGRVQRVVQVDRLSLGLEIYAGERYQLLASADPQHPRVYLVSYKLRRGVERPTQLFLLARKYVDGARLIAIEQPPFERLLSLTFAGPEGQVALLAELIERRANLILLEGQRILDAAHRVSSEINRYRTVLPGQLYEPPPPQRKLDPTDVTELQLRRLIEAAEPERPVWRVLVGGIAGVSPLFAREVVYRATGDPRTPVRDCQLVSPLVDAFEEALIPYWEHEWQPVLVHDEAGEVVAFAPYPVTHLGRPERVAGISEALERYYGPLLGTEAYQAAKEPLAEAIQEGQERIRRRLDALGRQEVDPESVETLRKKGELVLAYAATIKPGQRELRAQYDPEGPELVIELDPELAPVANAQVLFREYEKAKRAAAEIPQRAAQAKLELAYLDQLTTDLRLADNWPEIDEVRDTLEAAGYWRRPAPRRPRSGAPGPLRIVSEDGFVIWVGRNSRQNELVTFRRASGDDLWLHARGVPGGHVVIKTGGRTVPERTLRLAAQLAAGQSAARDEVDVPVDVVPRRRVHRLPGSKARPGMVTYRDAETLRVKPRRE